MSDSFQLHSLLIIGEKPNTRQFLKFHGETNEALREKVCITGNNGTGKSQLLADIRDHFETDHEDESPETRPPKATKLIASSFLINRELFHRVSIHAGSNTIALKTFPDSESIRNSLENMRSTEAPLSESIDSILSGEYSEAIRMRGLSDALYFPEYDENTTPLLTELSRHFSNRRDQFLLYLAEKPTQEKTVSEAIAEFGENTPNELDEIARYWNGPLGETAAITFHTNTGTFSYAGDTAPVEFSSLSRALQLFLNRTGLIFLRLIENNDPPSLILIDEPEAGLSKALLEAFIEIIQGLTDGQNTQLIFTTKNPQIAATAPPSSTFELVLDPKGTRIAIANQKVHEEGSPEASNERNPPSHKQANLAKLKRAIEETDDQDELANLVDELMSLRNL